MNLPQSPRFIRDVIIAGGILAPGSPIEGGFEAHLGGISLGLGLGWLIKSFIDLHGSRHAQQS